MKKPVNVNEPNSLMATFLYFPKILGSQHNLILLFMGLNIFNYVLY